MYPAARKWAARARGRRAPGAPGARPRDARPSGNRVANADPRLLLGAPRAARPEAAEAPPELEDRGNGSYWCAACRREIRAAWGLRHLASAGHAAAAKRRR